MVNLTFLHPIRTYNAAALLCIHLQRSTKEFFTPDQITAITYNCSFRVFSVSCYIKYFFWRFTPLGVMTMKSSFLAKMRNNQIWADETHDKRGKICFVWWGHFNWRIYKPQIKPQHRILNPKISTPCDRQQGAISVCLVHQDIHFFSFAEQTCN